MLGRAVKESPPGYLVKVDVLEKVKVRVLSKWFFFFRRGNVHKEGTAVRKHLHMGTGARPAMHWDSQRGPQVWQ